MRKARKRRGGSILRAAVAVVALVAGVLGATSSPVGATGDPGQFYDGPFAFSTITNCFSVIQGTPYPERGASVYTGAFADPDEVSPLPAVNQTFYMHVVVFGLGDACSGQRFVPAVDLPSGVSFDTTQPILCFTPSGQATSLSDCPQWDHVVNSVYGGDKMYQSTDTGHASTWPLPSGFSWEFRFPVRSSSLQNNAPLHSFVKMFDGNASPILDASAGLYVYGAVSPPSVLYDAPSTVAAPLLPGSSISTRYGIYSAANVFTNGDEGTLTFDFGTVSGQYPHHASATLPAGTNSWQVATDWDEAGFPTLSPGTTYFWRVKFTPTGGSTTVGAEQSFTMPNSETCLGHDVTVSLRLGQQPTAGDDVILGTDASESIAGLGGNDTICAGGGNDTVIGGSGSDTLAGGPDVDTLSYEGAAGVVVSLGVGTQNTIGAGTDTQTGFENLSGSSSADTLTGNTGANVVDGQAGNDLLRGGAGNDSLEGGPDNDTLSGNAGVDTASYVTATVGVKVSLTLTTAQNTQGAGTDTITTVEGLTGSNLNDRLTGNAGANSLKARGGTDFCDGKAGSDTAASCETRRNIP